jgi:isopentenyldiphosphate isomerase
VTSSIYRLSAFLDWVIIVEEVLDFKWLSDEQLISLVVHALWGKFAVWWQQLKQTGGRQGKEKINS